MQLRDLIKPDETARKQKFINYVACGVDPLQAGIAVGYGAALVSNLMETDEIKAEIDKRKQEKLMQGLSINDQYDRIETKALENLEQVVRINADPDLNLRIALLANRANRRKGIGPENLPINGRNGNTVHIDLSMHFVQHHVTERNKEISLDKKDFTDVTDFASPAQIENLMKKDGRFNLHRTLEQAITMQNLFDDD